jgi:hypothetical protein
VAIYGGLALAYPGRGRTPIMICTACRVELKCRWEDGGRLTLHCPKCECISGEWLTARQQRSELTDWLQGKMHWVSPLDDA